jgi:outer membrane protein OmpA-like peptidoglycan-associated protein
MNRLFRPTIVAALAAGGLAATASVASANVEIGGTAGIHVFSNTNELGVPDVADAPSERNSALFGLRLGVTFNDIFGIEGEFGVIPSESRSLVFDVWDITYRAHLIAQFGAADPNNKFIPFVLFGGGAMQVVSSNNQDVIAKDTDAELYAGIGAKYRVDNGWGLRGDGRILFPPSSSGNGATVDFEVLLSIYKEFGRKTAEKPVEAPKDTDGDGILDDQDKCPTEPGPKENQGCPDKDSDGDGIVDRLDKCPNEAEDKDGFEDQDGCPDNDNDKDGVPDKDDKCPNEAGPAENQGCPDKDTDGDGIIDRLDKCPDQPETKNGYQDEDGCPDEIPAKVKQFTGVIQGINFKVSSADLLPSSNATLNKAVAVLKEFPELRMEIQGHTDDQKFIKGTNGKFENNMELSQGRAESVKAYFVKNGIDESRLSAKGYGHTMPIENPEGLKGAKLNAARAKNRRVEFKLVTKEEAANPTPPPAPPAEAPAPAPTK